MQDLKAALNNSSIIINLVTNSSQAALRWKWCSRFAKGKIRASRNEAIVPRGAGGKQGAGLLCCLASLPRLSGSVREQPRWHFVALQQASGGAFPAGHQALSLALQTGACLRGFVSSLGSAHTAEAKQSAHGSSLCYAAGDGNSSAQEMLVPDVHT